MVWMTGKASFAEDLGHAVSWIEGYESREREHWSSEDLAS